MNSKPTTTELDELIRIHLSARCPFLYLQSWEEERLVRRIHSIASPLFESISLWTATRGQYHSEAVTQLEAGETPYSFLQKIESSTKRVLYILLDFHPYLSDSRIVRKLRDLIDHVQSVGSAIIFLSPTINIPVELEKDISLLEYPLPGIEDIRELFVRIEDGIKDNPTLTVKLSRPGEREALQHAALGLTENETKNAIAKALAKDRVLSAEDIEFILAEKEQIIKKSGVLEFYKTNENFESIGGLDVLRKWISTRSLAFSPEASRYGLPPPKGLLLVGIPGCGKSLAAKAVAHTWRQPLLRLDVGRLFEGFVGASEENVRRTIQYAEAVAPAVLWIDELEKAFAGIKSVGDSGTTARVFSTFLSWLQEKSSQVFLIATANDISVLPPELMRKGRFDEIFFIDLPVHAERVEILSLHLRKRGREPEALQLNLNHLADLTEGFSGAELEQLIVDGMFIAFSRGEELSMTALHQAKLETYPLSVLMKEEVRAMREWAAHRARHATRSEHLGRDTEKDRWAKIC